MRQVDADESPNRLAVVDRIFDSLVRQTEALLGDVHAQHALQAHRRTAAAIALRVIRQQCRDQRGPRRRRLDLGQEALASRQLLLAGELGVGKARLLHRVGQDDGMRYCASWVSCRGNSTIKSVVP